MVLTKKKVTFKVSKFPVKVRRGVKQKPFFVSPPEQIRRYSTTTTVQIVVVLFLQRKPEKHLV